MGVDTSGLGELGKAAVWYVEHGFGVFPVEVGGKTPATSGGLKDWTDNAEDVAELWRRYPNLNIGIVCGTPSRGLLVLDLDEHAEGASGYESLREWERENGDLPATCTACTGGGGYHMLYRASGTVHPSACPELGIDVRGEGSYIVAPPSVHSSGRRYEWETPPWEMEPAEADARVMALVSHVRPAKETAAGEYAPMACPEAVGEGGRNDTLYRLGCSLRAKGVDEVMISSSLRGVNLASCKPPLPDDEVERIVQSVLSLAPGRSAEFEARAAEKRAAKAKAAEGGGDEGRKPWIGKRGILHNELGKALMERMPVRIIDGAPALWDGTWRFGKAAFNRAIQSLEDAATANTRNEVFGYVMATAERVNGDNAFDPRHCVQFANCLWDVDEWRAVEPSPDILTLGELTVPLDLAPGDWLEWARALVTRWAADDSDAFHGMLDTGAACILSQRVTAQASMLVGRAGGGRGKASNGKSTFINAVRGILGSDNYTSMDLEQLAGRFNTGRVAGKMANLGDDIPPGFVNGPELATFKKLVTGDAVYADVKNADGFEFRSFAQIVLSMNEVPRLGDSSEGTLRRFAFVPFGARFAPGEPGYNPNMARTVASRPALTALAALFCMQAPSLIASGRITTSPAMMQEVAAVKVDNDSVLRWIDEEGVTAQALDGRPTAEVYAEYAAWCQRAGERNQVQRRTFTAKVCDAELCEPSGPTFGGIPYVRNVRNEVAWDASTKKSTRCFVAG